MPLPKPAAEWVPLDKLTPWAANPRRNDHAVEQVAASIERFGFASPIIARPSGEVIAGHTRLKAAQHLGLGSVPVRYLDLTDTEARALAIADNRLGELAEWDDEGLAEVMRSIQADGGDLGDLGWDDEALAEALGDEPAPPADDEAPEVQAEVHSRAGEVYELGPHRLACGDCRKVPLPPVEAVLTDPPYGIGASKMTMGSGQSAKPKAMRLSDSGSTWDDEAPDVSWLAEYPVAVIWGGNYFSLPLSEDWLVWHKNNDGRSFSECELAWTNLGKKMRHLTHHWGGESKEHITQKPLKVMVWCLSYFPKGCEVLDPFGGSGTTLIACAMTGRVARLIELDPAYCDVIRRRWTRYANEHNIDPGPGALDG